MALALIPSNAFIAPGIIKPFEGTGGTAPYTYSKVSGVGSINASTGVYSSDTLGQAVLQVTDSLLATAQVTVNVLTPIQLVCDIIQQEMGLANGRVYVWDQKIFEPTDSALFIAVGNTMCKPFSNIFKQNADGISSTQQTNFYATLSIDLISRDTSARDRKEELVMALKSFYAEQQQELNNFLIGSISNSFVNISQVDGSAIPYRFTISVGVQYLVTKTKAISYYDDFDGPEIITDP